MTSTKKKGIQNMHPHYSLYFVQSYQGFFSFPDYIWVTEIMTVTGNMFKKLKTMKCYIQKDQFSWMIQTNFYM